VQVESVWGSNTLQKLRRVRLGAPSGLRQSAMHGSPSSAPRKGKCPSVRQGAPYARYSTAPRSRSFTLVFARVFASTCFTITAQYSEYFPSADGNEPETTTLPAGTRP
jgi:hypothetical protein